MLDALPSTTLPIYRGLGQVPNMLARMPSGLVVCLSYCCNIVSREQMIPILDVGYRAILRVLGGIVILHLTFYYLLVNI